MSPDTKQPAAAAPHGGVKIMVWPDGTWCWQDEYCPADYASMSDDFEIIDMDDMPRVERLARDPAPLCDDILNELH